jgi:23S rRNA (adenine2503-C2)-methyltransferase
MDLSQLEKVLESEPAFRLRQIKQAVFNKIIDDWRQVSNLPLPLRQKLDRICPLEIQAQILTAKDKNSFKASLTLTDGLKIETVLLRHQDGRNTACLSSQIGCALGCLFCATGQMGFKRNLRAVEIVEQVLLWTRWLKKKNNRVSNLVFMGMGEPFLNYDHVLAAIRILNDKDGLNIGARHISLSSVGVPGGFKKLAQEPLQLNLAWSLHAPNDKLRVKIIPANRKYPLTTAVAELNYYLKQTGRRVMVEYLMIDGLNDSRQQALELAELLKQIQPPLFFVNLIAYNPTAGFKLACLAGGPSPAKTIFDFKKILREQKIDVTERSRFGQDIKAACGQLVINPPSKGG